MDVVGPGPFAVQAVVGYDPRIVVLGEHQRPPRLVHVALFVQVAVREIGDGAHLLGRREAVLGAAHFAGDALHDLAAPHEADVHVLLRESVVVRGAALGDAFEVFAPGDVDRVVADRVARADPRPVAPSGVLVAHAYRMGDVLPDAGLDVGRLVAPGRRLPDGVGLQLFAGVARGGEDRRAVGSGPVHQFAAVGGRVAAPAGVRTLERGVFEAEEPENLRQAAREARFLDRIGDELHVGEVAADLPDAVGELPDDALARDVVAVGLGVGRVGEFDARIGGDAFEAGVVGRRAQRHGVPRFGLDLQSDAPLGMRLQLIDDEARLPLDGIVPVDASVVPVHEIDGPPFLCGGGRDGREGQQKQTEQRSLSGVRDRVRGRDSGAMAAEAGAEP